MSLCRDCGWDEAQFSGRCPGCSWDNFIGRISAKVSLDHNTGCWIFTGYKNEGGYGQATVYAGKSQTTHRAMYQNFVGSVPDGLQIDHLCSVRACCNPEHLEAVTPRENVQRAFGKNTHCPNGHPYGEIPVGKRKCRKCQLAVNKKRLTREHYRSRRLARRIAEWESLTAMTQNHSEG